MVFGWGKKGNYAYVCARVKAKKSSLLTKDNYPKLLKMDLNEIGRFLGETQYNEEMAELGTRYSGVNLIELGTSRNLARVFSQIIEYSTGELKEMLSAYLTRWDFWNIKTILRGKQYGAAEEDIQEDLVAAGEMSGKDLNYLLSLESLEEVLEEAIRLKELAIPERIMTQFESDGKLTNIEDYLDKVYYSRLLDTIRPSTKPKRLFLSFIRKEIDMTNLSTLLKLKKGGVAPEKMVDYFLEGGEELTVAELNHLGSLETDQMIEELADHSFYEDIQDELVEFKETGSLTNAMLALDRHLIDQSSRFSHVYPLSVLPVLDFLLRKKIEVDNIRVIARGKEGGLDTEVIEDLLVV